jgi:ribokinase
MRDRPRVTVLGSLNIDIAVTVPSLPGPGATVLGGTARFTPGGKGANQAVAAARLGGQVLMAGCTGADAFGAQLRSALESDGVDISAVTVLDDGTPTGLAMITVEAGGENMITVAPGANYRTGDRQVRAALDGKPDILVLSAEIPLAAIEAALSARATALTMLNLAPAPPRADALALLKTGPPVDWLIVNETEAAAILGHPIRGLAEAVRAAQELKEKGARNAVVTAGREGVATADFTVPAFKAQAVDTVGAGDTFTGALAVTLAAGLDPRLALEAAAAAAATKVTRLGAQAGMPAPRDIETLLGYRWPVDLE